MRFRGTGKFSKHDNIHRVRRLATVVSPLFLPQLPALKEEREESAQEEEERNPSSRSGSLVMKEEEMELGSPPPTELSPEEEMLLIRDTTIAAESQSKEGDTFYLISQRWWQQWLDYVSQVMSSMSNNGYGSHNYESGFSSLPKQPTAIDNSDLIYDVKPEVSSVEIELHDTIVEGRDYILLPQEVWDKLYGWYGGGPTLPRKAINSGLSQTDLAIEVYPLRLQLLLTPKEERAIVRISKKETVGELHRKACEVFDLITDHVFIWDYYGHQKHDLMNDMDKTLDDANIQMDQDLLMDAILSNEIRWFDSIICHFWWKC